MNMNPSSLKNYKLKDILSNIIGRGISELTFISFSEGVICMGMDIDTYSSFLIITPDNILFNNKTYPLPPNLKHIYNILKKS